MKLPIKPIPSKNQPAKLADHLAKEKKFSSDLNQPVDWSRWGWWLWSKVWHPTSQSILLITILLLLSRGLGFVRQVLIYQKMDQLSSDLLLSSLKIPETIISFLIMGTVASSVLPVATRIEAKTKSLDKVSDYFTLISFSLFTSLIVIIASLLIFTRPVLVWVTSPEILQLYQQSGVFEDYVWVTRILLSGPLLFAIQGVFGVYLTMKKQFLVYGSASLIYNLSTVLALLVARSNDYFTVAWGMTIGAGVSSGLFILTSLRNGLQLNLIRFLRSWQTIFHQYKADFIQTIKLFLPRILVINGAVLANLIIIFIAQDKGQITAVDIGLSIQALFLVLISAVGTVFFPDLAKLFHSTDGNLQAFWRKLFQYTEKVALLAWVGSIVTFVCIPLVMWLFELFGKGQDNASYIILLARVATLGLLFQSVNEILGKYFFVRERVWQPVLISVSGTLVQLASLFLLLQLNWDAGVATALALVLNNLAITIISFYLILVDYKRERAGRKHFPVNRSLVFKSTN